MKKTRNRVAVEVNQGAKSLDVKDVLTSPSSNSHATTVKRYGLARVLAPSQNWSWLRIQTRRISFTAFSWCRNHTWLTWRHWSSPCAMAQSSPRATSKLSCTTRFAPSTSCILQTSCIETLLPRTSLSMPIVMCAWPVSASVVRYRRVSSGRARCSSLRRRFIRPTWRVTWTCWTCRRRSVVNTFRSSRS